jgi:hypothetical protein
LLFVPAAAFIGLMARVKDSPAAGPGDAP